MNPEKPCKTEEEGRRGEKEWEGERKERKKEREGGREEERGEIILKHEL